MGKRKKEITRIHAEEKKKKQEEENALAGLHPLLVWLKLFLILSLGGNLFMILRDGVGSNDIIDLIVNLVFLALLVLSIVWHERKKGVYCFFAYGILEILYQYLVAFLAWRNGVYDTFVGNRLIEYTVFTAAIMIPLFIYYRKRIGLLK